LKIRVNAIDISIPYALTDYDRQVKEYTYHSAAWRMSSTEV
jgi:hypothetical protein